MNSDGVKMTEMQFANPVQHVVDLWASWRGLRLPPQAGGISSHLLAVLVHPCSDVFGLRLT